jgi:hypothetical protein
MTIPANLQQAAAPWGAEAVVVTWGTEGGPYNVTNATNPLPVQVIGSVTLGSSVTIGVTTSGGCSVYRDLNPGTTGVSVKGSAGQVYGWFLGNSSSGVRYIKLYDKATAPTSGDTPKMTIPLPANAAANVCFEMGITFSNGIGYRVTTGVADNDTGAPSANDVQLNLLYN